MNDSLVSAVYHAVPFIPGIYSVGAYLVARPSSSRVVWVVGLLIATGLTASTTVASVESGIALPRLLAAWTTLYGLPMILALTTMDVSRRVQLPRWVGVLTIVAVCLAAQLIVRYVSFVFVDLVEARG